LASPADANSADFQQKYLKIGQNPETIHGTNMDCVEFLKKSWVKENSAKKNKREISHHSVDLQ